MARIVALAELLEGKQSPMTTPDDFAEQLAEARADDTTGWHRNPADESHYGQRNQNRYERWMEGEQP